MFLYIVQISRDRIVVEVTECEGYLPKSLLIAYFLEVKHSLNLIFSHSTDLYQEIPDTFRLAESRGHRQTSYLALLPEVKQTCAARASSGLGN